jgi:hypothetical protein
VCFVNSGGIGNNIEGTSLNIKGDLGSNIAEEKTLKSCDKKVALETGTIQSVHDGTYENDQTPLVQVIYIKKCFLGFYFFHISDGEKYTIVHCSRELSQYMEENQLSINKSIIQLQKFKSEPSTILKEYRNVTIQSFVVVSQLEDKVGDQALHSRVCAPSKVQDGFDNNNLDSDDPIEQSTPNSTTTSIEGGMVYHTSLVRMIHGDSLRQLQHYILLWTTMKYWSIETTT